MPPPSRVELGSWAEARLSYSFGPDGGEIESINLMNNQYALYTTSGCKKDTSRSHTGHILGTDYSIPAGCVVAETKQTATARALHKQEACMRLNLTCRAFWSRPNVPENIQTATSTSTLDTSTWGPPSAAYSSSTCDYNEFFAPQQLLFTTTLCGDWAGVPWIYDSTCHTRTNSCVNDNVIGPGSTYNNAYWEISYLRGYAAQGS
ncbi:hypothetical protein F5887DRAFT_1163618 [Amanita rubescens]|nr:hypothetical protein F5887DRAFT_1163618 [Amanita rubescens]